MNIRIYLSALTMSDAADPVALESLFQQIKALGSGRGDLLDDAVYDACCAQSLDDERASAINNQGLFGQAAFLLESGWNAPSVFQAALEVHDPAHAQALRSQASLNVQVGPAEGDALCPARPRL